MKFSDIIDQACTLLQRKRRLTYRSLKLEFALDDEQLDVLKEELITGQKLAIDEDGKVLVWAGSLASSVQSLESERVQGPKPVLSVVEGPKVQNQKDQSLAPSPQLSSSYTLPHLAERIRAEQAALEAQGSTDGERKTITALFADLKGSTALIEGLDPEEARAIIDPALQLMMDAVHRYEGYVAQALGDGIFALFGAPIAHEDHPQRALYAALRMQEEMRRYSDQVRLKGGPPLQMRIGINTGEVVVRSIHKDDLHTDYVPVGHSTNLAARMEQMATPGSILVTAYTHKLTAGYFEFKALGEARIKGVEGPLKVYEVLGAGPLRTRLQVSATRGLTRFVGRQSEMEHLKRALEQAQTGHGQIVGVMGEPGLGKSRLFYEFKLTAHSGCLVLDAFSVSYSKASPYLPLLELLKSYFQIQPQDDERTRREKVGGKVLMLDRSLEETLPYLFFLLGLDDATSSLQQMDPQIRRRRTFEAIKKLFLRESLNQLVILIFEDLHWIDTETQGFLDALSESMASARLLLLVNYRPEYRHEWGSKTYYTQLRLAPLGRDAAEELLTFLLGTDASLTRLKQLILEKTEGTPFFMEEVVQTLVEEGVLLRDASGGTGFKPAATVTSAPALHIPTTVQGVLAARIDRLAHEEKALLQQLAVIGRVFPLGLIKQVVTRPEEELYRLLSSLQHKEFLYEQPAFPEVEYIFKHALTQEVAYGTVLQEQRKAQHEKIAQAMEALYSANLEDHYSDLAHHYSRSPNTEKAIEYLQLAGQQAVRHSANTEAINHLTAALELLKTLPDTAARARQELLLHLILGPVLTATKGYATPEVAQIYTRARELCQQEGEPVQLLQVLFGLFRFHVVRAEYQMARELGEQLLALAEQIQDSSSLVEAHRVLGTTFYGLGKFSAARGHVERGMLFYDPRQHRTSAFLYGQDPGVFSLVYAALTLWHLGYPDQALKKSQEALSLAQELKHFHSQAIALDYNAWLHQLRREEQVAQERAEATNVLCLERGFTFWSAMGTLLRGWALALQGQGEEGISQIREGLAVWRGTGAEIAVPHFLALLTEAFGKIGKTEEASSAVAEALAIIEKTGECHYEAELHRLKGELILQQFKVQGSKFQVTDPQPPISDPQVEAEACFLKAIEVAQKQQAKSLELRAATSLARLWQQQGKRKEAHELLSAIYSWFTEGFDTKDLQEAKALIEELSH